MDSTRLHIDDALTNLQRAFHEQVGSAHNRKAVRLENGIMMRLKMLVSSSTLKKTTPFAVPGRWRTMTQPATRTIAPLRFRGRSLAGVTPSAFIRSR
jgi:hypothetical protein